MPTKKYLQTHRQVVIPNEAHQWLVKRAGEIQQDEGRRISLGEVLFDEWFRIWNSTHLSSVLAKASIGRVT